MRTAPAAIRFSAAALLAGGLVASAACSRDLATVPAGELAAGSGPAAAVQAAAALAGSGSGAPAAAAADLLALAGTGAGTNAAPAAAAVAQAPSADPSALLRYIPDGADAYLVVDFSRLTAFIRDTARRYVGANVTDEMIDAITLQLLNQTEIPASVTTRLRPSQMGNTVLAMWTAEQSVVVVTGRSAIADAPAPGGDPQTLGNPQVQMVGKDDVLVIGLGTGFTRALSRDPSTPGANPQAAWPEGWSGVPADAFVRVFAPNVSAMPPEALADLAELGLGSVRKFAFGMSTDGSTTLLLDADSDAPIRHALGQGQALVRDGINEMRAGAPATAQPWIQYLELVGNGLFANVRVERTGTVTSVAIPRSACAPSLLLPMAVIGTVAAAVEDNAGGEAATWTPPTVQLATSCATLPGPAPRLPRSLTRLAPATGDGQGALLLMDIAGVLRSELPTAFGLLPYSLRPEDVTAALGTNPIGLNSLADAEGSGAFYLDVASIQMGMPQAAAVLPAGMAEMIPPAPDPTMVREVRPGVGLFMASTALAGRLNEAAAPTSPWERSIAGLPANTSWAVAYSGAILAPFYAQLPASPITDLYRATNLFVIGFDGVLPTGVRMVVNGDASALAASANQGAQESARAMATQFAPQLVNVPGYLDMYSSTVRFEASGADIVDARFSLAADASAGELIGFFGVMALASGAFNEAMGLEAPAADPMGGTNGLGAPVGGTGAPADNGKP